MEYAACFRNLDTRLFSEGGGKRNQKPTQKPNLTNSTKIMMSE